MRTTNLSAKTKLFFNKKNLQDTIFSVIVLAIMIIIITNPQLFTSGTISGLKLFFYSVLPGLFPFMFLTKLLTELGIIFKLTQKLDPISRKLFGTPGVSLYAFIMSILSGYPIGAKIIEDLYSKNLINEIDAKKMSVFCTTSGPIFVIGTVGSIMFKNLKIGVILYLSHVISSFVMGILYNILSKKESVKTSNKYHFHTDLKSNILSTCISQTINALFVVGAYITIFYLLSELFIYLNIFSVFINIFSCIAKPFGVTQSQIKGVIFGIIEVTRGAKELSLIPASNLSISLCSAILSFSGISIILQSMAFLQKAKIKAHNFVFTKCVHSIFSFSLCFLICLIFI